MIAPIPRCGQPWWTRRTTVGSGLLYAAQVAPDRGRRNVGDDDTEDTPSALAGRRTMRAVIVGGGIAGLSAAHSLLAEGFEVVVLEQAQELVEIGAGINLAPNATRVLRRYGLLDALRRDGVVPEATVYRRWSDGKVIARRRIGHEVERAMGAPLFTMHRADLQRALVESLPAGVVRLGAAVVDIEQGEATASAVLDSGERVSGAALIAADGIRSRIRERLFGDGGA